MSDLFMTGSRRWDERLIRNMFYPDDAMEILSPCIMSYGDDDFIAWHFEKNGFFLLRVCTSMH